MDGWRVDKRIGHLILLLAALALALSSCSPGPGPGSEPVGSPTASPATGPAPTDSASARTREVDIFFITNNASNAVAVTRTVPGTPDVAANAIRALIEGPAVEDSDAGLTSAVPEDTRLLGLAVDGGLATIDLSREFEAGAGSATMFGRLGQVVYTLTQFPTITQVQFELDGTPVTVFSSEGILLEDPVTRNDFVSTLPLAPVPASASSR